MSQSTFASQVPQYQDYTRRSFMEAVLREGGWPVTDENLQFLLNMAQREHAAGNSSPQADFNLLNTTQSAPGASDFNKVGVKNYATFDEGVRATVATLKNGYYKGIVSSLNKGTAAADDAAGRFAKDLSTWSGGAYSTVSDTAGRDAPLDVQSAPQGGLSLNDVMLTYAPELAQAMGDPQVKTLLQRLDDGLNGTGSDGISIEQFETQLEQTNWWKNTPQSQRQEIIANATDPATAAQSLTNLTATINTQAAKMGVGLPTGIASQLALRSINGNWTQDQLTQELAEYAKYQGDITYKGEAATDVNSLRGLYQSMALPSDNATLNGQLQAVLGGKLTIQDIQDQLAQQAATFYAANPQLADFLKGGGGTARQWASPLITQASNLLGVDPNSIDLTNSQWSFLLKPQTNPQTGQSTGQAQTLDSVEAKIKTDPVFQYSKTPNGIADYQQLRDKLQAAFTGGGVS